MNEHSFINYFFLKFILIGKLVGFNISNENSFHKKTPVQSEQEFQKQI